MPLLLGCIADDLTGATDLANELARAGLRTVLRVGADSCVLEDDTQALVIALKSRSIPAGEAVALSLRALDVLVGLGAAHVYFKYCSTFDSTPLGNIGPVLEALSVKLEVDLSIACPAFPANRRTVYQGHLFVGDRLLEHSGMEKHPLNPMTRSDLVALLQEQMTEQVGLLSCASVMPGVLGPAVQRLRTDGVLAAIADAVDDAQLDLLGAQCAGMRLSSGASGLGAGIARHLAAGAEPVAAQMPALAGRRLILSGSCSVMTLRQVAAAQAVMPHFSLVDLLDADDDTIVAEALRWIAKQGEDQPLLIYASAAPAQVEALRKTYGEGVGERLEHLLGVIGRASVDGGCNRLIVAGGETSGAVVTALGLVALAIGPEIAAGVPWTLATRHDGAQLCLTLKSGNFGAADFFLSAWELLPCPVTT